jgi:hypothetical protein
MAAHDRTALMIKPSLCASCGARTVRREALDRAVEQLLTVELLDHAFLVP